MRSSKPCWQIGSYNLSEPATYDLADLYRYGILNFVSEPADRYYDKLINRFEEIAAHPEMYAIVDHIREGYRRSVCGAHSIYYQINGDAVTIRRILRSQDSGSLGNE